MKIQVLYIGDRENMNTFTSQIFSGYTVCLIYTCVYTQICTQDILKYYLHSMIKSDCTLSDHVEQNCAFLTCSNGKMLQTPWLVKTTVHALTASLV